LGDAAGHALRCRSHVFGSAPDWDETGGHTLHVMINPGAKKVTTLLRPFTMEGRGIRKMIDMIPFIHVSVSNSAYFLPILIHTYRSTCMHKEIGVL
jgi:hypothetical protein